MYWIFLRRAILLAKIYILYVYLKELAMRVAKWGNSLAVRLPEAVVKALGLKNGDEIEIIVSGERQFRVGRDRRRERALARLRALKKPLPKGFRFDRDESHAR
jgi:antitoxin MazE